MRTYEVEFTSIKTGQFGTGNVVIGVLKTYENKLIVPISSWWNWLWGNAEVEITERTLIYEEKVCLDTDIGGACDWMTVRGMLPTDVQLWLNSKLKEHKMRERHFTCKVK